MPEELILTPREAIRHHLSREPYLTAKQISVLRRPDERACLISEVKPKNLSGTTRLLKEMAEGKELRVITYSPTDPQLYHLPARSALKELKLKHELLCGNLYVAYELTGQLDWWEAPLDY